MHARCSSPVGPLRGRDAPLRTPQHTCAFPVAWGYLSSSFADLREGYLSKRYVGFLAISWLPVLVTGPRQATPTRKPTHGTYLLVPRPATAVCSGLHRTHLPDLRRHRRRLGPL